MKQTDILQVWRAFHGERDPIAYLLRADETDFWLRTHSLAESQRYARNKSEMDEILRRYNALGTEVLGEGEACALFFPRHAAQECPELFTRLEAETFAAYKEPQITLCAARTRWQNGAFDEILRHVADDKFDCVSFLNLDNGEIFAPYDGGADLFVLTAERRDALRERYQWWLSRHPQGL